MLARSLKRILIVSASIGGGHVAAAKALEAACQKTQLEVAQVDMLDYTSLPFKRLYRQTYFDLVRSAPDFVDWFGKRLDRLPREQKSRQQRIVARLIHLLSYHLPRLISRYQPDIILHTHFLPPQILSSRSKKLAIPQAVVITDFAAHSLWLQANIARYFVGSSEVAVHLESAGVDRERICVSGIPIDLRFSELKPKAAAREKLGLATDRDVLLLMAGGLEERTLAELLRQLRKLKNPLKVIVITGRSEHLLAAARQALEDYSGPLRFALLGFSGEVPDYMAAADLLVGKPGGLTSSEALAAGLPFAIVQPYPLQEEANANYLLEHGAAMRIEPLSLFAHKLELFFADKEKQKRMQSAARNLARPEAARTIIRSLLEKPL